MQCFNQCDFFVMVLLPSSVLILSLLCVCYTLRLVYTVLFYTCEVAKRRSVMVLAIALSYSHLFRPVV